MMVRTPPSTRAMPLGHDWSVRTASITAGSALLLMALLGGLGYLVAIEGLVTPQDATRTATDIAAAADRFRFGILSLLAVIALDVLVAVALHRVFRRVHATLALLAAALRLVYAAVFAVAVSHLTGAVRLLEDTTHLDTFGREQLHAQVLLQLDAFTDVWDAGLLLFGLHLVLLAELIRRSGRAPKILPALVAIAGLGYLFDSAAAIVVGAGAPAIATVTFVGEVVLAVWLVVASRRLTPDPRWRHASTASTASTPSTPSTPA